MEGSSALRIFFMTSVPTFLEKYSLFGKAGGAIIEGLIIRALDTVLSHIIGVNWKERIQSFTS